MTNVVAPELDSDVVLDVRNLEVRFRSSGSPVRAVNGASFSVGLGKTLGIVGESGSGKTASVLSCLRLTPKMGGEISAGQVLFGGRDLLQVGDQEIREIRGNRIALVMQDPMASLNPVLTVRRQITEPLRLHKGMKRDEASDRAIELLGVVGIPDPEQCLKSYPHQLSGGMRQRVMIAMALSCEPDVLIADEPTTALDVTIQAQIVSLVRRLQARYGMAIVWISHDMGVIARLADQIAVMYAGYIVEKGPARQIFRESAHPYTIGLLASVPRLDVDRRARLDAIKGLPPDTALPPSGCPFYDRCVFHVDKCRRENPPLAHVRPAQQAACWIDVKTGELR